MIMWIYNSILIIFIIFCLVLLFLRIRDKRLIRTVTGLKRGFKSERLLVLKLLKSGFPAQRLFHDLYLRKQNGEFSQIDLLAITEVGIIVFEVKDYSGWIFGDCSHTNWTQVMAYGRSKYRFYNPIMQNNRHISELKKQLDQFENIPFYSVVVFYGDSDLRKITNVPEDVYIVKPSKIQFVLDYLKKNRELVQYEDIDEITSLLSDAVRRGDDKSVRIQHVKNVSSYQYSN